MAFAFLFILFSTIYGKSWRNYTSETPVHYNVASEIFDRHIDPIPLLISKPSSRYDSSYIPKRIRDPSVLVNYSMELYQLIEINEPQQYMTINAWTVERWVDMFLGWDPNKHMNMTEILVPHDKLWIPDTTLYNSLVMDDKHTKRLLSAKLVSRGKERGALVELLYPAIYKLSCKLDLRFFPFDLQKCHLLFGSWGFDNTLVDYVPHNPGYGIGTGNCLDNEGWEVIGTSVKRIVNKYACCPNNYTLLEFHLFVQRKPLYYIISLIIPTSIITFISIIGFFSSPSINDLREDKISLGITTLLSMSILVFMVSDKIPSTSSFILIGWFYTSMILLISFGTLASSLVIFIQKKGLIGHFPGQRIMKWARLVSKIIQMEMPLVMKQAYARKAFEEKQKRAQQSKTRRNLWYKLVDAAKEQARRTEDEDNVKKASISSYYNPGKGFDRSPNPEEAGTFDDSELASPSSLRNLAQLEYDWLAAVVERIFLILFIIIFIFFSFGINLIGFYRWKTASMSDFK